MKILLAVAMLSLLVSCNDKDIDGVLKAFKSFALTDEDGRQITIEPGTHGADFSYKARDKEVELEIDDLYGDDRDFIFSVLDLDAGMVAYDVEGRTEQMRLWLPSSVTGQTVKAEIVVSNTIISQKPPRVFWDRCNAYLGVKGGLAGLLGLHERSGRGGGHGGLAQHIYTVSSPTKSQLSVKVSLVAGEETVAVFEGSERRKYRDLLWEGKCGDYARPVIRRD